VERAADICTYHRSRAPPHHAAGLCIEIQAKEILSLRRRLNGIYVHHTGQSLESIESRLERDSYMSAEEARDFGIVDEVVESRPTPSDEIKA